MTFFYDRYNLGACERVKGWREGREGGTHMRHVCTWGRVLCRWFIGLICIGPAGPAACFHLRKTCADGQRIVGLYVVRGGGC